MRKWAIVFALAVLAALPARAVTFQPTVNPLIPVQNSPLSSLPIRNNFQYIFNDESMLASLIGSGGGGGGSGTVTTITCSPTAPVTCSVTNPTTTPTITIGFPIAGQNTSNVQMALGSTTSGDVSIFDTHGNLVDGGAPLPAAVTWPTSGDVVVSSGTNTPTGIAEVDGECVKGTAGAWGAGSCGSSSGVTLSSTTSSINSPLAFTNTGTGSLSTLYNATGYYINPSTAVLNIPSGATYDINGTQIACANLSNGATGCSTATGTSGATLEVNNASNTVSGNNTYSGTSLFSGALPALTTGDAALGASSTGGGLFTGKGSTDDVIIENSSGTSACVIGHNATTLNCTGLQVAGTSVLTANQSITLSGVVTGSGTTAITTAFGTFNSATLSAAISDETGTGAAVFAGSPTFTGTVGAAAITATGVVTGGFLLSPPDTLTISTATFTPVSVASNTFRVVLVHASCPCTIANPSGSAVDGERFLLEVWQSATGSDAIGTWGTNYDFGTAGAPTLSTGASAGDVLGFTYSAQKSKYLYLGVQQGF